jgi:hypothetical protein
MVKRVFDSDFRQDCKEKMDHGMLPSALRDCSTSQFRCAMLSELEFHEEINILKVFGRLLTSLRSCIM